jgi:hypothetical protein
VVDPSAPVAVARTVQRRSSALSVAATTRGLVAVGLGFLLLGSGFLALGLFIEMGQKPDRALLAAQAAKLNTTPRTPAVVATNSPTSRTGSGKSATASKPSATVVAATPTATARASASPSLGAQPTGSPGPTATAGLGTPIPVAAAHVNLALHRPVTVSSHSQNLVAANVSDGDAGTYWEGESGFPQTLTVDLGSVTTVGQLGLALPTCCDWSSRTQTIAVYGSQDGVNFVPILGPADYTFDANGSSHDTVTVPLPSAAARFVQLRFTANSGWFAAQLAELQIHSSRFSTSPDRGRAPS